MARRCSRERAIPAYLACAEQQPAPACRRGPRDWRDCATSACRARSRTRYFAKTLPQLAAADLPPRRDALVHELQAAGNQRPRLYQHLHDFVSTTFFEDPRPSAAGLKAATVRIALSSVPRNTTGRCAEPRVNTTAAELYASSWPIVQATRTEMMALARQISASQKWPVQPSAEATVRAVFEQMSQNAPHTDAEMAEGYRKTGQRLVAYARTTGLLTCRPITSSMSP